VLSWLLHKGKFCVSLNFLKLTFFARIKIE